MKICKLRLPRSWQRRFLSQEEAALWLAKHLRMEGFDPEAPIKVYQNPETGGITYSQVRLQRDTSTGVWL